jgi:hypothetical protein
MEGNDGKMMHGGESGGMSEGSHSGMGNRPSSSLSTGGGPGGGGQVIVIVGIKRVLNERYSIDKISFK